MLKLLLHTLLAPIRMWPSIPLWGKAAAMLALITGAQFCVPAQYVPPLARLDGKTVGIATARELQEEVANKYKVMKLSIGDEKILANAAEVGIVVESQKTVAQLPQISLGQRLIPFGLATYALQKPAVTTVRRTDDARMQAYATTLALKHTRPATDAAAAIESGQLKVVKEKTGQTVVADAILDVLKGMAKTGSMSASIPVEIVNPRVTEANFTEAKQSFAAFSSQELRVQYDATVKKYPASEYTKWLKVIQDPATHKWSVAVNRDTLNQVVVQWAQQYNKPAGTTQVMLVDDVETARVVGASGRRLDTDAIEKQVNDWLQKPTDSVVALATAPVYPRVAYTRTYTKSSAQLQQKLNAWIASHSGTYQVAIQELGGKGRTASYNVAQQTVMASTYKLFVAYAVYHQAENGSLNLNTVVSGGQTIEQCISKSIIYSDNDCAIALGRYIGWANADAIVAAAGFQYVHLNNYDAAGNISGDKLVNAGELAKFLAQLSAGSLMNSANTSRLMNYMKQQVYRSGIPAGSHGATVADKVGFLEGYLHDAAIVYAPGSTYALVIMSSGSSWSNISSLADAVCTFMSE